MLLAPAPKDEPDRGWHRFGQANTIDDPSLKRSPCPRGGLQSIANSRSRLPERTIPFERPQSGQLHPDPIPGRIDPTAVHRGQRRPCESPFLTYVLEVNCRRASRQTHSRRLQESPFRHRVAETRRGRHPLSTVGQPDSLLTPIPVRDVETLFEEPSRIIPGNGQFTRAISAFATSVKIASSDRVTFQLG